MVRDMMKFGALALFALSAFTGTQKAHANPYFLTVQPITHSDADKLGDKVINLMDHHVISHNNIPATVLQYDPDIRYVRAPDYTPVASPIYGGFFAHGGSEYSIVLSTTPEYKEYGKHQAAFALNLKPGEAQVLHIEGMDFVVTPGAYKKI